MYLWLLLGISRQILLEYSRYAFLCSHLTLLQPKLTLIIHQYHKLVYAEDILVLNAANRDISPILSVSHNNSIVSAVVMPAITPDAAAASTVTVTAVVPPAAAAAVTATARLFGIATPVGAKEVSRLETSRSVIFESIRVGFAAAYDALVLDPADRVRLKKRICFGKALTSVFGLDRNDFLSIHSSFTAITNNIIAYSIQSTRVKGTAWRRRYGPTAFCPQNPNTLRLEQRRLNLMPVQLNVDN